VALTTLKNCWPARTNHMVTEQDRFPKTAADVRAGGGRTPPATDS
jgi:hypothetical protein